MRLLLLSLALAALLPATAAASSCGDARSPNAATVCWINAARASHGRPAVRADARLARAAAGHSYDMVANHYFAHDSQNGKPFSARIAATGWMRGRHSWKVGETLAWGTGSRAEPQAIVEAWLNSPPHRRILLDAVYRRVGIGIAPGTPADGPGGETYTADFGS